jgi:hypothetical protein
MNELEMILKEESWPDLLSRHLPGEIDENHEKHQSG